MAKVKAFTAEFGTSVEIKGRWFKFYCGIEVEPEPGEDNEKVKERAWNTVIHEVEKQIGEVIDGLSQ